MRRCGLFRRNVWKNKSGRKKSKIKAKRKKNEREKHMRKDSVLAYIKEYAKTQPDTLAVCELRKTVTYEQYFIIPMIALLQSPSSKSSRLWFV